MTSEIVSLSSVILKVFRGDLRVINPMQRRMSPNSTADKIFSHVSHLVNGANSLGGINFLPGSIEIFVLTDNSDSIGAVIRCANVPLPPRPPLHFPLARPFTSPLVPSLMMRPCFHSRSCLL
jgi:hypothetical protein